MKPCGTQMTQEKVKERP